MVCLAQMSVTVGTALNRLMAPGPMSYMLTEASMHHTIPTAASCCSLLSGPALFAGQNLLARTDAVHENDHHRLQLSIGTRGAHIDARIEPFGIDAYNYLVEGEQIWWLAPPEFKDEFHTLFDGRDMQCLDAERIGKEHVYSVHQCEGDTVYIPGGWIHAVYCLTPMTVAFGSAFLRAWKLSSTIDEALALGQLNIESSINIRGIFRTLAEESWGITEEESTMLQERWKAICDAWAHEH
jgi:hypothetical protein